MRYEKGHKELTRQRILDVASERFRREGIAGVGVASLMSEIGLTQGGFYNHFESKEELAREALAMGLERMRKRLRDVSSKTGRAKLESLVNGYLSASHRDNVGTGCMMAALASEASRDEGLVREQMTDGIREMVKLIGSVLPESLKPKQREADAMAVASCLIGTLVLARAVDDPQMSDRLLESGRRAAIAAAESSAA
jgi:TetR/AcrR family transcriptional regulator, transcriptional repressor for nem operon